VNKASIQTSAPPPAVAAVTDARPARSARKKSAPYRVLEALASLKLTVVLFVLSVVLVFCGTLAQIDYGIWAVVNKYFRWFYVWIPVQIFFPRTLQIPHWLGVWFPGGWTIGGLLLINVLAAHATRFKLSWRRSGILILHAGVIVLMLGELCTGLFAVEGNMTIPNGGSANYVDHNDYMELAVVDPTDAKSDDVVTVVPDGMLKKGGMIRNDLLPFDVRVDRFMVNSAEPVPPRPDENNPATAGLGVKAVAVPKEAGVGVDPDQKVDVPSAYVTLLKKGTDESLGTYLLTPYWDSQEVEAGGRKYEVSLRPEREYKPYTIQLLAFNHSVYPGTEIPKDFSSRVRLLDKGHDEDRDILIRMNEPLRYRGETFYQASFLPGDRGTVLQVVKNPGWLLPYVACTMVALGMLIHFGFSLVGFLRKRVAQ